MLNCNLKNLYIDEYCINEYRVSIIYIIEQRLIAITCNFSGILDDTNDIKFLIIGNNK